MHDEHNSQLPLVARERNLDVALWSALKNSIYPGAKDESVAMAIDYCVARKLDPLLKPVHLVPMSVKNPVTNKYDYRDVVMPGIGLYRIQADRAGNYAGSNEPEFGPTVTMELSGVEVSFPEYCTYTVKKIVGDRVVEYTAKEYWLENYATAKKDTNSPNAMWKKRPYAQLAKCTEAQALRRAWPELGSVPTAEEMEGKYALEIIDVKPEPEEQVSAIAKSDKQTIKTAEYLATGQSFDGEQPVEFKKDIQQLLKELLEKIEKCASMDKLESLQKYAADFEQGSPEHVTASKAWVAKRAALLRAEDEAKIAAQSEKSESAEGIFGGAE
jgi:phage recombination protein Bet